MKCCYIWVFAGNFRIFSLNVPHLDVDQINPFFWYMLLMFKLTLKKKTRKNIDRLA